MAWISVLPKTNALNWKTFPKKITHYLKNGDIIAKSLIYLKNVSIPKKKKKKVSIPMVVNKVDVKVIYITG